MTKMLNYLLSAGGGPSFFKPVSLFEYQYVNYNIPKALEINDVWDYVDNVFVNAKELIEDLDVLKDDIESLSEDWNQCIIMESQGMEYVYLDDITSDIENINSSLEKSKENCDKIFEQFNDTIETINEYLALLKKNNNLREELINKKNKYTNEIHNLPLSKKEDKISYYQEKLYSIEKELANFQLVSNIESYGRWVSKVK